MTLILCADNHNGLLFNKRRLSRDSAVCEHILALCGGRPLWMNEYSAAIFPQNTPNICVSENFWEMAGEGDFCFAENADLSVISGQAKKLVIYRWNRSYPSDVKLSERILADRKLTHTFAFAGTSHPCITQEVYE